MSHSETEMSEHITEHSLKELTNFNWLILPLFLSLHFIFEYMNMYIL